MPLVVLVLTLLHTLTFEASWTAPDGTECDTYRVGVHEFNVCVDPEMP